MSAALRLLPFVEVRYLDGVRYLVDASTEGRADQRVAMRSAIAGCEAWFLSCERVVDHEWQAHAWVERGVLPGSPGAAEEPPPALDERQTDLFGCPQPDDQDGPP